MLSSRHTPQGGLCLVVPPQTKHPRRLGCNRINDNIHQMQANPVSTANSIALGEPAPAEAMRRIERTLQLQHFKWDTHVGDSNVLSSEPFLVTEHAWGWLCKRAEQAAQEMFAFEREIARSPTLLEVIGVPHPLRKLFRDFQPRESLRTLRFDFHPTSTGWLLSEVNSDVPGGFGEASFLPEFFEPFRGNAIVVTSPLSVWASAAETQLKKGHVALLHAPGYLEDQQVVRVLGRELSTRGFTPHLIQSPESLQWRDGSAYLAKDNSIWIDNIIRFFQAEWLAKLPIRSGWEKLLRGSESCRVSNPLESVISESKRLPLSFDLMKSASPTWRELFPACRDLREISGSEREEWVLKAAYANNGDAVHIGADLPQRSWERLLRKAQKSPRDWVVQRRFETISLQSLRGPVRPCVGVFVIGDKAAGAYVRLSAGQITDAYAMEAPLFVLPEEEWR